jgi:hypothetical protein
VRNLRNGFPLQRHRAREAVLLADTNLPLRLWIFSKLARGGPENSHRHAPQRGITVRIAGACARACRELASIHGEEINRRIARARGLRNFSQRFRTLVQTPGKGLAGRYCRP